jgi:hypothetical protein
MSPDNISALEETPMTNPTEMTYENNLNVADLMHLSNARLEQLRDRIYNLQVSIRDNKITATEAYESGLALQNELTKANLTLEIAARKSSEVAA